MLTVVIIHIMLLAAAAAALIESANAFLVVVHHGHHRPTKTKMTTARTNNDGRLRSFVHDSSFRKIIRTALDGSLDNCDGENEQNNKEIRLVPSSAAVSAAAGSGGAVSIAVCEHDSTLFQQQQQQQEAAATEEMNLLKDYSTPPPPSPPAESVTADLRQRTSWEKGTMGVFLLLAAAAAAAAAAVVTFHLDDVVWLVGHSPPQQQFLLDNVAITLKTLPETTWNAYRYHLTQNPIVTKALTSATVYAVGDVISQQTTMTTAVTTSSDDKNSNQQEEQQRPIVEPSFWNRSWDRQRTVRSMVAGGIGHGPLSHVWYISLDGFFDHVLHWTAWWAFLPKIVLDQTTWTPIWNSTYLLLIGIMKRDDPIEIWTDIRQTTIPLILQGIKLWPAAHLITYGAILEEYRLAWVDLVEIFWVTILATQAAAASNNRGVTNEDDAMAGGGGIETPK